MVNILRDRYKVQKKDHEKAFEYQLGLKYNEEYEKVVEEAFLKIVKIFIGKYPGVKLDPPRGREKSDKSLENKIKKLAIERLSKKYSINEITNEELDTLYNLITEKVKNRNSIDEDNILEEIDKIFFKSIKDLDSISYIIEREYISDNTKKALLRMVYSKLIIQNDKDSKKMQNEIEYRYGEKAAEREKCDSKNLLHWEDIEILLENDEELKKVYDSFEYLRVKDLRAFKIIISSVFSQLWPG